MKTTGPACLAPQLTDETLDKYKAMIETAPLPIKESMTTLMKCVENWWNLPESKDTPRNLVFDGKAASQALDNDIKEKLWDDIPWEDELKMIQQRFDNISVENKALRDAAFHLLWYVLELNNDREPMHSLN